MHWSGTTVQPRLLEFRFDLGSHTHVEIVLYFFSYLKHYMNSNRVFSPKYLLGPMTLCKHDWTIFYKDAKEAIPPNAPPARGNPVQSL